MPSSLIICYHPESHPLNPFKNDQSSFESTLCVPISVGILLQEFKVYMAVNFVTFSLSLLMTSSEPFALLAALSFGLSSSPLMFVFTSSALLPHLSMCLALEEEVRLYMLRYNAHIPTLF